MKNKLRRRGVRVLLLATVLGAVVGAGFAYASIPDEDGVIHGCRNKFTGALRVIDTDVGGRINRCNSFAETPLDWNHTGPEGQPGPGNDARETVNLTAGSAVAIEGMPFGSLGAACSAGSPRVSFHFNNDSGGELNVWLGVWDGTLTFTVLGDGASTDTQGTDGNQRWTLELSSGARSGEIDIWATGDGDECHLVVHSGSDL